MRLPLQQILKASAATPHAISFSHLHKAAEMASSKQILAFLLVAMVATACKLLLRLPCSLSHFGRCSAASYCLQLRCSGKRDALKSSDFRCAVRQRCMPILTTHIFGLSLS